MKALGVGDQRAKMLQGRIIALMVLVEDRRAAGEEKLRRLGA
ncbi:hypothetical protein [Brevundimonas fontaquae]|nr:hypothetical protein [Brevundimonas fontaquae]